MAIKMSVLQIPQALIVHNMATKKPCRALFIEPFRCTFIVEYKLIWTVIWREKKKQEDLITFLKGQNV